MIPTITIEGKNIDFNPMDKNTYNGFQNITKNRDYTIVSKKTTDNEITAQNHKNLIPPVTNGISGF